MMRLLLPCSFLLLTGFSLFVSGQQPTPTPKQDEAVRITTNLVQIDVLVVDKDGKQITDLKPEEFVLKQDGKVQKITRFGYYSTAATPDSVTKESVTSTLTVPRSSAPPVGRLITFIVDDGNCALSNVGMVAAKEALEKFVIQQMQPNDRVAIYQTRAGSSVLQQYTSNKDRLLQSVRSIRWRPPTGSCSSPDGSFFEQARSNQIGKTVEDEAGNRTTTLRSIENDQSRQSREAAEDFNRNNQAIGTIGVINYVVRGLEGVAGRKMVFLLSDGLALRGRNGISSTALQVMRDLTDKANRASVVFNTISVRGTYDSAALDVRDQIDITGEIDPAKPSGSAKVGADRERFTRDLEEGMYFLANETGGDFYRGSNFLDVPINKALSLERGYYLLGYEPDEDTFKGKEFNKIDVSVTRIGAKVASRSGFLPKPDVEATARLKTSDSELYQAIAAPLPKAGLELQLTAFFGNTPVDGSFIRSFVAISGNDINFTDEAGGLKKAVFDVVAVTLDEKNKVVDEFNKTHTIKVDPGTADAIKASGLIYFADVPVKQSGVYNLRFAIRDVPSKQIGSAGQSISIPDLKQGRLLLSGLSISELGPEGKYARPSLEKSENGFSLNSSRGGIVTRQFRSLSSAAFSYTVYNAGATGANITAQVNLYKDGKLISEGKPKAVSSQLTAPGRIDDFGFLRFDESVAAGEYTLELIVRDEVRKQAASQSIDFSVIN